MGKSMQFSIILVAILAATACFAAGAQANTTLGVKGPQFTLDGEPAFLLGISYYGALGAPRDAVLQDLDDMVRYGINWVRVWATWSAFDNNVSALDNHGNVRQPHMDELKWLLTECDQRGIVIDVTLTKGQGRVNENYFATLQDHENAVTTVANELRPWRNWYLDLANEHNIQGGGAVSKVVSMEDAAALVKTLKKADPERLVTISYVNDADKKTVRSFVMDVGVDFLSPHRHRRKGSPEETADKTRECLRWMKEVGRVVPVHYQEPFRRSFRSKWEPEAKDFLADLKGAIDGGAAGWCFHNGDSVGAADGRPRRSFDLREGRLFEQLDAVEQAVLAGLGKEMH